MPCGTPETTSIRLDCLPSTTTLWVKLSAGLLHFLKNFEPLFILFLNLLQREESLIHVLHNQLSELVRIIMMKFPIQSVVGEKTGKSLLSLDVDNTNNRLKYDREMEISEPISKTLKKLRREPQQRAIIMDMCCFYCTASRYLTRHLPFANELLYDLAVHHPLMLKEDEACQVIR